MSANPSPLSAAQVARYGLMGLPLAFVALPLYVLLPNHYARTFGVPLATLGALLLATRLLDALIDPLLGRWSDRLMRRSGNALLVWAGIACALMAGGFALLFFPPLTTGTELLVLTAILLVLTYACFSAVTLAHQSWGALLGAEAPVQSRIVAWREGLGLVGVLLASVVPVALGLSYMVALFALALGLGWLAWRSGPRPAAAAVGSEPWQAPDLWLPWRRPAMRRLLAVFVLNGIASAVPATLVLFFVQDRLQASSALEPLFLGSYFLAAALSMPLWLRAVGRWGLARSWIGGMGLAVAVFVWAATLGAGDALPFIAICVLSGAALGADLVMPGAMLAGVMARVGDLGRVQGGYYGWWAFATKLNLALAAGLALPLLALFGYVPGARESQALQALTVAYCLLPCVLKLAAAGLLYHFFVRKGSS
ncbi:MAG: MFS transporter [Curvibacter sp.]|jgi:GPH family glycoside/pentoside/hexuronide:cation symporter|nr:MFS transporter [Curvibacter sp.]